MQQPAARPGAASRGAAQPHGHAVSTGGGDGGGEGPGRGKGSRAGAARGLRRPFIPRSRL